MSALSVPPIPAPARRRRESTSSWRLTDRIGLAVAWGFGLLFCAITVAIVAYFLVEGLRYLRPSLLVTNPRAGFSQSETGGFLDPLLGTLIMAVMSIGIALPVGTGIAVWLSEYGRPAALARVIESTVEMLAGAPEIVLALFGLLLFESPILGFFSQT
ncbi:MAG: hypothetical protein JOZ58_15850, partial [Acetobacteraceae bacterium]|nr:hypothetical protein [Acetobacteraceae bacterium]